MDTSNYGKLDLVSSGIAKVGPGRAQALPTTCCALPLR